MVVVLGHIDHGKTTLLDQIRKTHVAKKEAGGITQHIGAYQIVEGDKKITFIDTPGHEAFSAMRSRGSKVADLAILVVDSSEGVKAQTKEAISHIKKSGIPIIVALNKIDKPEANPEKAKRELTQEDVVVESLGGKTPSIEISALTGQGIPELLELILLVAEMENLKVELTKKAEGVVIESYLDHLRGPTATLLITEGVLKQGDILGTFSTFGKIKKLEDFQGRSIEKALPSDPAIVIGFEDVPKVGENFKAFPDLETAKNYLKIPVKKAPEVLPPTEVPLVGGVDQKVLNLILKTDVLGSIEAIEEVLNNLPQERVVLRILKSEAGEVNEGDIKLVKGGRESMRARPSSPPSPSSAARSLILGFRVKINPTAKILAEREKIKIMTFDVIYDLVEGVRKFMEKELRPERVRTDLGKVKALIIFLTEKNRQIVGGKVIEGEVKKGASIEIFRGENLIGKGKLVNLQKNKKDVDRAPKGEECGLLYEGDTRIEEGNTLVIYQEERKKSEL